MYREGRNVRAARVFLASFACVKRALIFLCLSEACCTALERSTFDGGISQDGGGETIFRAGVRNPYGSSSASNETAKLWKVTPGSTRGVLRNRNVPKGEYGPTPPGRGGKVVAVVFTLRDDNDEGMSSGSTDPLASGYKSASPSRVIKSENRSPGDSNFVSSSPLPYGFGSTTKSSKKDDYRTSSSSLANGSRVLVRKGARERENVTQYSNRTENVAVSARHRIEGERSRAGKRVSGGKAEHSAVPSKDGISTNYSPVGTEITETAAEGWNQPANNERSGGDEKSSFTLYKGSDIEEIKVSIGGYKGDEEEESLITPYFIVDAPEKKTPRIECAEGKVYFMGRCRTELH